MQKIPMFFTLTFDDKGNRVIENTVNPQARFLFDAQNVIATIKRDGTAAMLNDAGEWFLRRCVKKGKRAPYGFLPLETDPKTGHTFGWEPAEQSSSFKFLKEVTRNKEFAPGTYELVAPKINGNPENVEQATLFAHGTEQAEGFPSIQEIKEHEGNLIEFLKPFFQEFKEQGSEGVVFWADNAPAVKLRVKDFFPEMDARFKR